MIKPFQKISRLFKKTIQTPLGPMLAIADTDALYLLEFTDNPTLNQKTTRLQPLTDVPILSTDMQVAPLVSIQNELIDYFNGTLKSFQTPLHLTGTPFQKSVWKSLLNIPFGHTASYANLAIAIHKPTAFRAVANANKANQFAIIIPCHRIIKSNGDLCGYGGGVERKKWLIEHESNYLVAINRTISNSFASNARTTDAYPSK